MRNNKITWLAFGLLVLLQLWVPASVIFQKESTLKKGSVYKFRTAPVDPNDYLRGKYVLLQFNQNRIKVTGSKKWEAGHVVYVSIGTDEKGFAYVTGLFDNSKLAGKEYIKTSIDYVNAGSPTEVIVKWPFDRFYMEESKAPLAEAAYNKLRTDSTTISYALVKVKNGDAVLENVFINDQPIDAYIKK